MKSTQLDRDAFSCCSSRRRRRRGKKKQNNNNDDDRSIRMVDDDEAPLIYGVEFQVDEEEREEKLCRWLLMG